MQIFEQVEAPKRHRSTAFKHKPNWYTWSSDARKLITSCPRKGVDHCAVRLVDLGGSGEYPYGYSIRNSPAFTGLSTHFSPLADSLFHMRVPKRIMLFHGLIDRSISSHRFTVMLACVRDILADMAEDPMAALYPPLISKWKKGTPFHLHADLYPAPVLFNIFDHVATGSEGASIFLPVAEFCHLVRSQNSVPPSARSRLLGCFSGSHHEDRFNDFYQTVYGEKRWQSQLAGAMSARQMTIKLHRGEGYLLHDRSWLHGRTATSQTVTAARLHRLVFTPKSCLKLRTA